MKTHLRSAAILLLILAVLSACNYPGLADQDTPAEPTTEIATEPASEPSTDPPEPELESVLLDPCTLLQVEEVAALLGGEVEMQPAAGTGGCSYIMQGESPSEMTQLIISAAQGEEAKSLTVLSLGMLVAFSGDPSLQSEFEAMNSQMGSLSLADLVRQLGDMLQGPNMTVDLTEDADKLTLWVAYETDMYNQGMLLLVQGEEYVSLSQVGSQALKTKEELGPLAEQAFERLPPAFYVLDADGDGSMRIELGDETSTPEVIEPATSEPEASGLLWATAGNAGQLYAIEPSTNEVIATIDVGRFPHDIATVEGSVWIVSQTEGSISEIDADSFEVIQTINLNGNTMFIAAGEGGIWIAGGLGVRMVDLQSGTRYGIVYNACYDAVVGGGSVWVSQNRDRQVLRIDPETRRVVSTVKLDGDPTRLAYGNDRLWVVLSDKNEVVAVDPETEEIINRLTSKYIIHGVTTDPDRVWYTTPFGANYFKPATLGAGRLGLDHPPSDLTYFAGSLWAASPNDGFVTRIDPEEATVLAEINIGTDPGALAGGE